MLRPTIRVRVVAVIAGLLAVGAMLGNAAAQKAALPKSQDNLAIGEDQVRQLLPLMKADKEGMISRQEYMGFMESEFERLDKDKKGELDIKKLASSNLTVSRYVGK